MPEQNMTTTPVGIIPPVRWPNGQFAGGPSPIRSQGSIRGKMKAVLEELSDLETEVTRAEAIARAIARRAETGNVQAAQLLLDQTEDPIDKRGSDPTYAVTIHYVHQQLNLPQDAALPPPTPSPD